MIVRKKERKGKGKGGEKKGKKKIVEMFFFLEHPLFGRGSSELSPSAPLGPSGDAGPRGGCGMYDRVAMLVTLVEG